jgi:hypothetical protein
MFGDKVAPGVGNFGAAGVTHKKLLRKITVGLGLGVMLDRRSIGRYESRVIQANFFPRCRASLCK